MRGRMAFLSSAVQQYVVYCPFAFVDRKYLFCSLDDMLKGYLKDIFTGTRDKACGFVDGSREVL